MSIYPIYVHRVLYGDEVQLGDKTYRIRQVIEMCDEGVLKIDFGDEEKSSMFLGYVKFGSSKMVELA